MKIHRSLFYFLFPCLFFSCGGDEDEVKTYSVDPELDLYLQKFLSAAKQHGKNYDLESDGLIMEFADLPSPKIGLCHFTDPIKVQIDRTFWQETAGKADQESQRENTVFHELGHGLLRRQHVNTKLPNTEWKSLMCGGEQVDDRGWFVNFTGARKQYYLDELFEPGTSTPDFLEKSTRELKLGEQLYKMDIRQSVVLSNPGNVGLLDVVLDKDFGNDFYWEVVAYMDSSASRHMGLCIGSERSLTYYDVYASGRILTANTACWQPFAEVFMPEENRPVGSVRLGLWRHGDELSFYVNGTCYYWNDFPLDSYQRMGLCIPANDKMLLKSFVVYGVK
ncbi:MAG: hypothetical protein J6Y37_05285 [Paludibacteraceae bacterium]|nr:hypothetical protein [Paludibacteraceae bacterium]